MLVQNLQYPWAMMVALIALMEVFAKTAFAIAHQNGLGRGAQHQQINVPGPILAKTVASALMVNANVQTVARVNFANLVKLKR